MMIDHYVSLDADLRGFEKDLRRFIEPSEFRDTDREDSTRTSAPAPKGRGETTRSQIAVAIYENINNEFSLTVRSFLSVNPVPQKTRKVICGNPS
jgi:hypothetical protein